MSKCMHPDCPDYDLCENCEALPIAVHPEIHPMLKMKASDTVIPTVYRVGQKNLIPEAQPILSQESQPPRRSAPTLPLHQQSPQHPTISTFFGERIQTPTPAVRVAPEANSPPLPDVNSPAPTPASPVRPPLPPKPEMMSHPSWASIPGFFWPSPQWDAEPFTTLSAMPDVLGDESRASLTNPFADIAITETPTTPAAPPVSVAQVNQEEIQERSQCIKSPEISFPSVPSHTPNPWPTTNPTERQELLQLIADFVGPSTSPNVSNALSESTSNEMRSIEDKKSWVSLLHPPSQIPMAPSPPPLNYILPVNPDLQASPIVPEAASSEGGTKAITENKEMLSPDNRTNAGFGNFSMPHLLGGLEQRVVSSEAEPKLASSIAGSVSGEALLRRPSPDTLTSNLGYQRSLAELIRDIPVPPTANVQDAKEDPAETQVPLSALFVEDVTVPDGQIFPPGAEFMKCWRLLNTGARDWPESTELVFVAGEPLSAENGSSMSVGLGKVAAGVEIEVWTGELKVRV